MKLFKKELFIVLIVLIVFPVGYWVCSMIVSAQEKPDLQIEHLKNPHAFFVNRYYEGNTLVVSVMNCGDSVWKEKDGIRCAIIVDNTDIGLRADLPKGTQVAVGETVNFRFAEVKSKLNNTAEIVMLQENVDYFPERLSAGIDDIMQPQENLHCALVEQYMDGDSLVVTMENTGEGSWKEKDWIRCTIFIDGVDSGLRAELQPGQSVAVGENVVFIFHDVKSMLSKTAEIVMLQENVFYFEERFTVECK